MVGGGPVLCKEIVARGMSVVEKEWVGLSERHDLERLAGRRYTARGCLAC